MIIDICSGKNCSVKDDHRQPATCALNIKYVLLLPSPKRQDSDGCAVITQTAVSGEHLCVKTQDHHYSDDAIWSLNIVVCLFHMLFTPETYPTQVHKNRWECLASALPGYSRICGFQLSVDTYGTILWWNIGIFYTLKWMKRICRVFIFWRQFWNITGYKTKKFKLFPQTLFQLQNDELRKSLLLQAFHSSLYINSCYFYIMSLTYWLFLA